MALVAPTQGDREFLRRTLTRYSSLGDSVIIRLFKNKAGGISKADSVRTFIYPTATGYAQQTLTAASWTYAAGPTGDTIFYPQLTFTFTGADSINGYYLSTMKMPGDSIVLYAEVFTNGPYVLPAGGGTIRVTPQVGVN